MARNVLITGANRGIGLGLVADFLNKGDRVVATARDPEAAEELQSLQRDYHKNGQCHIETLDIASELSVKALALKLGSLKSLDILINNAGVIGERETDFATVDLADVARTINVNALGTMRVTQAVLSLLGKSPKPIVASITSKMGSVTDNTGGSYYGYRMSKAALNMFNMSFSRDHQDIIAIVLHPGWVQTDMGGKTAPVSIADSVAGMGKVIDRLTKADSGKFLDFRDYEIPW